MEEAGKGAGAEGLAVEVTSGSISETSTSGTSEKSPNWGMGRIC